MNRTEYMEHLQRRLRRLPKEDYDRAIAYFTEYFEEAGPEREAQAIEDLGSPELAADQIVRDFAVENAASPTKNVKRAFPLCGSESWQCSPHQSPCRCHWPLALYFWPSYWW